jgi:redox-sensitive bicupin YhaK (pirin superfamily)
MKSQAWVNLPKEHKKTKRSSKKVKKNQRETQKAPQKRRLVAEGTV